MPVAEVGSRVALWGVNGTDRIACDDPTCPLEHFRRGPVLTPSVAIPATLGGKRYHYVDHEPSAHHGTVIGHDPGANVADEWRHRLLLDDLRIVTADAASIEETDAPPRRLPGGSRELVALADPNDPNASRLRRHMPGGPSRARSGSAHGFDDQALFDIVRRSGEMSADQLLATLYPVSGGSATPGFANVPRQAVAQVVTANTARDGSGTIADILTGVAAGTKIEEVTLQADGDPADSIVTLFLYNGSAYRIIDEFDLGNPAAASTTVSGYRVTKRYDSLYLPSASWKIAAAITVALTAGNMNVWAAGADL